jgi:hypothetical protein
VTSDDSLFATTWVHAFEEDTPAGEVYRPDTQDVPLSRRPRRGLSLSADGSARILAPGPDDRLVETSATWRKEGDELVVRTEGGPARSQKVLRVSARPPDRLVVKR